LEVILSVDIVDKIKMMVVIRTVEEKIAAAFFDQKIFSFLHIMAGQEASPVGCLYDLSHSDLTLGNHRSHGHYLAKGGNLDELVYEVFGDIRGCCKGFGGSMHMLDRKVGFMGTTPILGSVAPLSVGYAYSLRQRSSTNVAVCFVGDGAAEEGVFSESVNLAGNKGCPLIFVIEDNGYAVNSTNAHRKSPGYIHQDHFKGLGAEYIRVNGQHVWEVSDAMQRAKGFALKGKPVVLHIDVLRRHGHSGPMKENTTSDYRLDFDTLEHRGKNDCIALACDYAELELGHSNDWLKELVEITSSKLTEKMDTLIGGINVRG
jgi:TPP-dependent pyruvate/acetoin dehydrogenase alpha subunit